MVSRDPPQPGTVPHTGEMSLSTLKQLAGGLLAATLLTAPAAQAMDLEVTGGYTFDRFHSLFDTGVVNANLITDADSLFPTEWSLGYVFGQDKNPDNKWNNDDPTTFIGVGKRVDWHGLFAGFGIIAVDRTSQRLSSTFNFKTQLGFHYGPFVAMVQHLSNGGLKQPNDGENFYLVGVRFSLD